MTSVTRPSGSPRPSGSQSKAFNDRDILVAGTPNSQSEEESTDPSRDNNASQSDIASQSQPNPGWLVDPRGPSQSRLALQAVDSVAGLGQEKAPDESGSLEFDEQPAFDHPMYAAEEPQTQLNTPPEESIPESSAAQPDAQLKRKLTPPPTPQSAKKQKQNNVTRDGTPELDSFGSGDNRAQPRETDIAKMERLRRERQVELAVLSLAGSMGGRWQEGDAILESGGGELEALHAASGGLGDKQFGSLDDGQSGSLRDKQSSLIGDPKQPPNQDESREEESATQLDTPHPDIAIPGPPRPPSPEKQPDADMAEPECSQSIPLAQASRSIPPPVTSPSSSAVHRDGGETDIDPSYRLYPRLNLPTTSSPQGDRSFVPDSEIAEGTQTSDDFEPTQQEADMSPAKLVVPAKPIMKTMSVNTVVSNGTSGKGYTVPKGRRLVRAECQAQQDNSVSWMEDRLPGTRPGKGRAVRPPSPPVPAVAESSKQAAANARRSSPLKKVVNRSAVMPRSESPTPGAVLRESPESGSEADPPEREASLEPTSPVRPVTSTYGKSGSRRSRSSFTRKTYNEDTTDEEVIVGRRKKRSATPMDADESYRPAVPARARLAKVLRKPSTSGRRSTQSAASGSVVPATPETMSPEVKHSRVLGYWKQTKQWYPATVYERVSNGFTLQFDDGSTLEGAHVDDIRQLKMVPSDTLLWVKQRKGVPCYIKAEWMGTTTNKASPGPLVYKDTKCSTEMGYIPLSRCSVQSPKDLPSSKALPERRLRADAIVVAVASKEIPIESPVRSRFNSVRPTSALHSPAKRGSMNPQPAVFAGAAFFISLKNSDDGERHKSKIEKLGGTVLAEFADLFPFPATFERGRDSIKIADKARYRTAFCIVDEPSSKPKFLCALALGMPCLSWRFVEDAMSAKTKLDWRMYLVSAGKSERLGTWASQVVNCAWADGYCLSDLLENEAVRRPLWGKRVAFCSSRKDSKYYPLFPFLLCALGASSVIVEDSYDDLEQPTDVSVVIVKDTDAAQAVRGFQGLVGTVESIKQTLIVGGWQNP